MRFECSLTSQMRAVPRRWVMRGKPEPTFAATTRRKSANLVDGGIRTNVLWGFSFLRGRQDRRLKRRYDVVLSEEGAPMRQGGPGGPFAVREYNF